VICVDAAASVAAAEADERSNKQLTSVKPSQVRRQSPVDDLPVVVAHQPPCSSRVASDDNCTDAAGHATVHQLSMQQV